MSVFVLIPGAGGHGAYWDALVPEFDARGHDAVAVDIQQDDPALGLPEYAAIVEDAIGERADVVLVAQSMGGFTAPIAAERLTVDELVLVNAMIPIPGETAGEWWDATGSGQARDEAARTGEYGEFDVETYFFHDVDTSDRPDGGRDEHDVAFGCPCDFATWPEKVRVMAGADDRFFPVGFQERIARERLGVVADVLPGGHLIALARPELVADYLLDSA
jgi:predicted alpha/beta hydrolase family esterase